MLRLKTFLARMVADDTMLQGTADYIIWSSQQPGNFNRLEVTDENGKVYEKDGEIRLVYEEGTLRVIIKEQDVL